MNSTGYSIKDLEVLSGIKAHTIRIWEKRYNLLKPQRTQTNIRTYNDNDLRRMLNISMLVRYGFKISKVARWSDDAVNKTVLEITRSHNPELDYMNRLILYMVNFDNVRFGNLVDEIISAKGLEDATTELFFDFFIKVGVYWQVGSVFPAQEHYVTNFFRHKFIAEIEKLEPSEESPVALFFLHQDELHELSLLFYNYVALKNGYRTIYLGQAVPWEDLVRIKKQVNPVFIFTAFINSIAKENLEAYLANLKDLFRNRQIFITGLQVKVHQPDMPSGISVIRTYKEFTMNLQLQNQLQKESYPG